VEKSGKKNKKTKKQKNILEKISFLQNSQHNWGISITYSTFPHKIEFIPVYIFYFLSIQTKFQETFFPLTFFQIFFKFFCVFAIEFTLNLFISDKADYFTLILDHNNMDYTCR